MILARCPACATTFRVRPEQLRARQGRVRCGQCNHAFNALETLVDENAVPLSHEAHEAHEAHEVYPQPQPPQPSPDTSLFVLEEKEPVSSSIDTDAPLELPPSGLADETAPEVAEEEPLFAEEAPEPAADTPSIDEPLLEPTGILVEESPAAIDPGSAEEPAPLPLADLEAETPEALTPAEEALAATDEPDVLPADTDAWPAMNDEPVPAPDERMEPGGEITLPPEDEWPPADHEALIDEFPAVQIDDTPPQSGASPVSAAPDTLASDPLLEFGMDDDFPSAAPSATAPQHFQADWPDPADLELKASPRPAMPASEPVIDFDALLHKEDAGEPATGSAGASPELPPPAAPTPLLAPPEPELPEAQDKDDGEDEPEDEAPSSLNQALWAAGATLLSLALLAQGVLVFRNEIALSSPPTRPALEALCSSLGCELPLPREAAEIAIESSDIQPDAGREAFFTLHATLRNRADFQQAWPHLEVTLTDARDKALVRRVLEPAQWLPADAPRDAFPARREIATRVAFEAPGVAAAGYRVYAFYP